MGGGGGAGGPMRRDVKGVCGLFEQEDGGVENDAQSSRIVMAAFHIASLLSGMISAQGEDCRSVGMRL